jgi:UrcA family protein
MFRSLLAAATAAAAIVLPQAPAASQGDASITVTGPSKRASGEPAHGVRQRTTLTSNVTVEVADLDLRTEYGRWLLDQRIRIAADAACNELDALDSPSALGGGAVHDDCRSLAMRRSEPQMQRVLRAAG